MEERKHQQKTHDELIPIALEALGTAVVITDRDANIQYVNQSFESITGYASNEVIGQNMTLLKSGRQSKEFYKDMWEAIQGSGQWEGTLWNKRKDGVHYHESLRIRRFTDLSDEVYYVGVFSDISEQDALQRALIDAQKRELMATMAAGIAHNFNNYMQAIMGYAELGREQPTTEKMKYFFSGIISVAERSTKLVKEMLKFSHPEEETADGTFDLTSTLQQAIETAGSMLPSYIELVSKSPANKPYMVNGSDSDIEQTILNLVANARDAVKGKQDAKISVELDASDKIPQNCQSNCQQLHCPINTSQHVILKVKDNGAGIPKDIQSRVFEPFFSTKEAGKGTGLGLASAKQIVTRMGGAIWLDSDSYEMRGSSISICLPLLSGISYEI